MKINKSNYEMFFLDYHEGNLPAEHVAELFLFLEQNPALKAEFESFENIALPDAQNIIFPDKDLLKRGPIGVTNYTRYFIGHVEQSLTVEEENLLASFLVTFPVYKTELELFKKTKLQPDFSVVYPDKKQLKKPIPLFSRREAWYFIAAAACITFLFGLIYFNLNNTQGPQMAHTNVPETIDTLKISVKNMPQKPVQISPVEISDNKLTKSPDKQNIDPLNSGSHTHKHPIFQKQLAQRTKLNNLKNINEPANDLTPHAENIAYITPLEMIPEPTKPEISLAESKPTHQTQSYYTLTASTVNEPSYPSIGQVFSHYSMEKFKESINNKPLADELFNAKVPRKVKGIKFIGWCYERLTGKKVNVKTSYDQQGKLTAYHVSSGRFQFGKTFASR